jgi:dienelactone hydrolase
VQNLEKAAKEAGVDFTLKIWQEAGHAFMNRANSAYYNEEVSKKAMEETV